MRYLCQGLESRTKMELLFRLTKHSDNTKKALLAHFTDNYSMSYAAIMGGVETSNLSRAVKELNVIAEVIEKVFELKVSVKWYKIN